jgi:hypothetical protein
MGQTSAGRQRHSPWSQKDVEVEYLIPAREELIKEILLGVQKDFSHRGTST